MMLFQRKQKGEVWILIMEVTSKERLMAKLYQTPVTENTTRD